MIIQKKHPVLTRIWPVLTNRLMLLALTLAGSLLSVQAVQTLAAASSNRPFIASAYQRQLRSQVDTDTGAPQSGRDPVSQMQTSLASAASRPVGNGQQVAIPAAKLSGTHRQVDATSVLPDTKKTGILSSGCLAYYGQPGAQCVPAYPADNQRIDCTYIHKLFPKGIQVNGADQLQLGKNKNNIACVGN